MIASWPTGVQPVFERLHNDLVDLYVRWQMFRQLFGENEQRVALLNAVAPAFFGTVQVVLMDDVLSGIARMTDKVKSFGKDNLVVRQLMDLLDTTKDAALIAQLKPQLSRIAEVFSHRPDSW